MAERIRKEKQASTKEAEQVEELPQKDDDDHMKAETEALLDEIDELLGEFNAEELVKSYVQKGGE